MTPSYRRAFSRKADENLATAEIAFASGHFNAAASRVYYAVYHALIAVLHERTGFRAPSKNSHVKVLKEALSLLGIEGAPVDQAFLQRVATMKNQRLKADYKPTLVEHSVVEQLLETARLGISNIQRALPDETGDAQ